MFLPHLPWYRLTEWLCSSNSRSAWKEQKYGQSKERSRNYRRHNEVQKGSYHVVPLDMCLKLWGRFKSFWRRESETKAVPLRLTNYALSAGATLDTGAVFAFSRSFACFCCSPEGFGLGWFCMGWFIAIAGMRTSFCEAAIIHRLVNRWTFSA